ncbi:uncharacterized protein RCC_00689 [Ramularia collo-cygni]|uniref:Trichothecene 3-O-acetyltransferase n=1 Tax=Ramularia collo-cygni TaxID=112498 RepID=A0A2D3V370_9PEZI|nr:uncharacterized protein RCC_00689 [Ramularia collo-cygni]CZT14723.1 uncharacterized protein RCC_00689 [Ramularia collo-cygni]
MSSATSSPIAAKPAQAQDFWVLPSTPIPAQTIFFPAADQIGINTLIPDLLCFKTTPEFDEARFIEAFKKATAGTVSEIPALAGRVVYEDETCKTIKCVIEDNDKVLVRLNWMPHLDASELEAQHWPSYYFPRGEVSVTKAPMSGVGTFNFGIQANFFKGGLLIVITMNHLILDGSSIGDLELIFAHHLSRALDGNASKPSGLLPPAALDKSVMWGSKNARPLLEWKDWRKAPPMVAHSEEAMAAFFARFAKLTTSVWYLSPEKQAQLRAASQKPGQKLSVHLCFSTWLWGVFTRARGLSPDTLTRNFTVAQTRGRVKVLHPNHCGNALVYGRAKATASELRTLSTDVIADRIAKSVSWWTEERIREQWGSIEAHLKNEPITTVQANMDRDFGTDVEFSNVTHNPLYKVAWGRGIELARKRPVETSFADGYLIMFPKTKDGGFEIVVYAETETLKKMAADPKFREYAEYRTACNPAHDELIRGIVVGKSRL